MNMIKKITGAFLAVVLMISMAVPVFAAGTTINITKMHDIWSDECTVMDEAITDSYGNKYTTNVLKVDASNDAQIAYDLNGAYSSFSGQLVCSDGTGSGASMSVGIFADGKLVYEAANITRQDAPRDINIDLSGVGILEIRSRNYGEYSCGWLFFVNSTFTKAENAATYNGWKDLNDFTVIDSDEYEYKNHLFTDNFGGLHDGVNYFDASNDAYALFNLNSSMEKFKGTITTFENTGDGASMSIKIYADDKLVLEKTGVTKRTNNIPFEIDVTGVKVLKIVTSNEGEYSCGWIYVADDMLTSHIHTPEDWKITTEATCTEDGERVQYCSTCGEIANSEKIPATGHTPDGKWVTESDATCGEEGEQVQHCSVCKEICDTQKVDKLPHTPASEWEVSTEPRCDAEGLQVKKCTVCGEVCEEEAIPTVDHSYGSWEKVSGSVWNNPIVIERTCSICGDVEHVESNSTSWLKPLVIVLFVIIFGGLAVIIVTLKMNGLALEPASIKKLFSKESLTDDDIDDILNKPDDNSDNK